MHATSVCFVNNFSKCMQENGIQTLWNCMQKVYAFQRIISDIYSYLNHEGLWEHSLILVVILLSCDNTATSRAFIYLEEQLTKYVTINYHFSEPPSLLTKKCMYVWTTNLPFADGKPISTTYFSWRIFQWHNKWSSVTG